MSPILTGVIASGISGHLTPTWSPEGAYDALNTVTVPSGGAASIEFIGIPTGYKHLQIRMTAFYTGSVGSGFIAFNGEVSSSNYSYHSLHGDGVSSPGAIALTGQNQGKYTGAAGTSPTQPNVMVMDILDYKDTNKYKTVKGLYCWDNNGSGYVEFFSNLWQRTSAINSIVLTPANTFAEYTSIALYGVK